MDREQYILTVLEEVENYSSDQTGLVVSLDRRMTAEVMGECVEIAVRLKNQGRRVVGVDLCGHPKAGNVRAFENAFRRAKEGGLGVTIHIAEVGLRCVIIHLFHLFTIDDGQHPRGDLAAVIV